MKALLLVALLAIPALAQPSQVILIRHGEKPNPEGHHLNARGEQRAQALVKFFQTNPPVAIYAMRCSAQDPSVRPIETVLPLARALGQTLHLEFSKDQLSELATEIRNNPNYTGKTVLVCWEHKVLPAMVKAFGWSGGPEKWPGKQFDRAWILHFRGANVESVDDVPEHLLPGDSSQ